MKVIITGNGRSGSSFITNLVHTITKYNCGQVRPGDRHNKWGYWENVPLNNFNRQLLHNIGIPWNNCKNPVSVNWNDSKYDKIKSRIIELSNGIELYKDNVLILMPELYQSIFPDAKWIYTKRNLDDSFNSAFGTNLSKSQYLDIVNDRFNIWNSKKISKNIFTVNYEDFDKDLDKSIYRIAEYLEIKDFDFEKAKSVYRTKEERS